MAGVLLSESEYRHELQADIEPFEGLLLGFFFISVGMSADLPLARAQPGAARRGDGGIAAGQGGDRVRAGTHRRRRTRANALRFGLALPQASEFSFVLFGAAVAAGALSAGDAALATLVTAASMVATRSCSPAPKLALARLKPAPAPEYDTIDADPTPVIICGFGRFGQIIGRVLRMHGIEFTALERDPARWKWSAASAPRSISAIPRGPTCCARPARSRRSCWSWRWTIRRASAHGRGGEAQLSQPRHPGAGAQPLVRAPADGPRRGRARARDVPLQPAASKQALTVLGIDEAAAERAVTLFRDHDEKTLLETHAIYRDEQQLIQSQQQAADELASLFEADRP